MTSALQIKLLGVRGSRPTHKPQLLGYGGNSTSFEFDVEGADFHLFIDGGSGLVRRGSELTENSKRREFHFLITHTHWDHILGLPFFEPLYNPKNKFVFYASNTSRATFNDLFFGQNRAENLPVPPAQIKANIQFQTIAPNQTFTIRDRVKVATYQLNHQGITLGYRVECEGKAICVITDNAPIDCGNFMGESMTDQAQNNPQQFETKFNDGLINFLNQADTVVFDTHFTEQNLKADWGHSTPERALAFCAQARVKRLVLFHHAPEDTDQDVDAKVTSVKVAGAKQGVEVVAAKEGQSW